MANVYKVVEENNIRLTVYHDDSAESPRSWDNLSKMVCFHGKYNLGDSHDYKQDNYSSWEELKKDIEDREDVAIILPLYLYDHSGITISTSSFSCRWDSGQIGWVFITKKAARENFNIQRIGKKIREKLEKNILAEVEEYDQYLQGNIYGYLLEELKKTTCLYPDCKEEHEDTWKDIDSCWGFMGYDFNKNGLKHNLSKEYQHLIEKL